MANICYCTEFLMACLKEISRIRAVDHHSEITFVKKDSINCSDV